MADGTSFEISIPVKAEGVGAAASAVEQLEARLKSAGLASAAAAEAVKAGAAAYSAAETAANRTATAAERIGIAVAAQEGKLAKAMETGDPGKIEAATQKLLDLGTRQDEAKAKAEAAANALATEATNLDALKVAASGATDTEKELADSLKEAEDAAKKAGGGGIKLNEMAESLGKMGGPAGIAGQKIAGFGNAIKKLSAMGPAGIFIAIGVALVAVVAGIGMAAVGLLKFGFASADAARTSMLLTAGIAGSVEGGKALEKTIDDLGNTVPMTAEELRGMADGLAKSGLKGDALSAALEDAAIKAAKLKFGPEYAKAMLGADFQTQKLKANLGKVFGGLKTDGVMAALQRVVALFDTNSSSAQAIKVVFESMFQPAVDGIEGFIPKVVAAFIQFEIWAMRGLIAMLPYVSTFKAAGQVLLFFGQTAMVVLGIVGAAIGFAVLQTVAFMAALKAVWDAMTFLSNGAVALGGALVNGVAYGVGFLMGKFAEVKAFLAGMSLSEIGTALIDGLATGLTTAGPKVLAAITGVASGAITAAKKALGIASPSKVFAEIGGYTAEGMSQGVDAGAKDVEASYNDIMNPPKPKGGSGASSSGGSSGHVYNIYVTASGDGDDIAAKVREAIESLMASATAQMGKAVATAAPVSSFGVPSDLVTTMNS